MKRMPTHPGIVFKADVLEPLGISVTQAAEALNVSRKALSELVNAKSSLTTSMALRIAKATNTTAESWLKMQMNYDLWHSRESFKVPVKVLES